ncbi:hypothetical protein FDP41_013633 [Naegleria fowleri]|uniref:Cation-transporting P-type ATPase N-terminal domain-containing protein n=1 Tax=Naegleria fowleri TaxID=5763 RepID=A0A6A5C516_NAEFO|nr:uncharacterized protein FDP41_013633 [Naegleria fowleri]KAF0980419.1 hypothetical protein FDP41_013633 [Naegleria fowleri]CAG4710665.1 unnamed protein product [Naegleria fowleri]
MSLQPNQEEAPNTQESLLVTDEDANSMNANNVNTESLLNNNNEVAVSPLANKSSEESTDRTNREQQSQIHNTTLKGVPYYRMNLEELYLTLLSETKSEPNVNNKKNLAPNHHDTTTSQEENISGAQNAQNSNFGRHIFEQTGLSEVQVSHQREKYGENNIFTKLIEKSNSKLSFWKVFINEVQEPMILLLFVVGLLYVIWDSSIWNGLVIFICILLMVIVEVVNEYRSKKGVQQLKSTFEMSKKCTVRRNGELKSIMVTDLVPGDVLRLNVGQVLPADVRLFNSESGKVNIQVDQSALTGESLLCNKHGDAIDTTHELSMMECNNILFAGTYIVKGKGFGVVINIGCDNTHLGSVLNLLEKANEKEKKTELQKTMKDLAKYLTIASISITAIIVIVGWIRGFEWRRMLLAGLSVMFATIPEELPIIIKSVLALGSLQLSKKNLLIKKLHVPESMATTTHILTDKTGTMTKNCLQLTEVYQLNEHGSLSCVFRHKKKRDNASFVSHWILDWLLSDSSIISSINELEDPFEKAVVEELSSTLEDTFTKILEKRNQSSVKRLEEFSFDHQKGFSSIVISSDMSPKTIYSKGIPEKILEYCNHFQASSNRDLVLNLEADSKQALSNYLEKATTRGMRVIGLCRENENSERIFTCFLSFIDPIRPGVKQAIKQCKEAGIRVVMISGDHTNTAVAVADECGLLQFHPKRGADEEEEIELGESASEKKKQCIEGKDVNENVNFDTEVCVVSRATPKNKYDIVELLRNKYNYNVIVSGDGINDAAALDNATVGVAMGKSGVDLAKESADVILTDDNFSTIVTGIMEGRKLYENLRKSIQFYLSCKVTLVSLFIINIIIGGSKYVPFIPMDPIQIILLELFSDIGAATAFVIENEEEDIMKKPPKKDKQFVDASFLFHIAIGSASLFISVFLSYLIGAFLLGPMYNLEAKSHEQYSQSMAMMAWLIGHVTLAFNMRTTTSPLFIHGLFTNVMMNIWIAVVGVSVFILQLFTPLSAALKIQNLGFTGWVIILLLSILCICWLEVYKWMRRGFSLLLFRGPMDNHPYTIINSEDN